MEKPKINDIDPTITEEPNMVGKETKTNAKSKASNEENEIEPSS
jgi:hypothetical protein